VACLRGAGTTPTSASSAPPAESATTASPDRCCTTCWSPPAPASAPARRKDRLRFLIAVSGTDGHHALLSWAEIDPDFGRAPVLLAVSIDDTSLDRAGPQLVLPQDRCGARHISGITAIRVDGGYTSWT